MQPNVIVCLDSDDFCKSANDADRSYRALKLENGLKVLIVSDETTKTAAASLSVGTGGIRDPEKVPGLAHFLEHMLFLGTERYPSEQDYSNYISRHGGLYNASTYYNDTNYFFNISAEHLKGALDRFSAFFTCPLFTASCTEREINAVHEEFQKNFLSDAFRENRLFYSLISDDHPLNKFISGNKKTLVDIPKSFGIDVRDELFEFYSKNYSSHIMSLTVVGKESLDDLQSLVTELFSGIKRNSSASIVELSNPFEGPNQLNKEIRVVPIRDRRVLEISFNVPYMMPHYRSNPDAYVSHLIGHEGSGSLLRYLQDRNLVLSLMSYNSGDHGFETFRVSMELTEEGFEKFYDIITAFFQYVHMMKLARPQQRIYAELKKMAEWSFRYQEKLPESTLASRCSRLLHFIPPQDVLKFGNFYDNFDEDLIQEYIERLNPDNLRIILRSKSFLKTEENLETEKIYGTKYSVRDIPEEWIKKWKNSEMNDKLFLPKVNPFIPDCDPPVLTLKPDTPDEVAVPSLSYESEYCRLWFKKDDCFFVPKSVLQVLVRVPMMTWHPLYNVMAILFIRLLQNEIQEIIYEAELAGISSGASHCVNGFELTFKGLSEKMTLLVLQVIDKMSGFEASEERKFLSYKDLYKRSLENALLAEPYKLASSLLNLALLSNFFAVQDLLLFMDQVTFDRFKSFVPQMMSSMHLEILAHGNFTLQEATDLCHYLERTLKETRNAKPLLKSEKLFRLRCVQIPNRALLIYGERSIAQPTYALCCYFQVGPQSNRSSSVVDLYCQILSDCFMAEVRTQKQLGYALFFNSKRVAGVQGLILLLQSSSSLEKCDAAFEDFLASVPAIISKLSEEEFSQFKEGLQKVYLEKPKKLSQEAYRYWSEILSGNYHFRRYACYAKELKLLTKKDLLQFHLTYMSKNAPERRKLSIAVLPAVEAASETDADIDSELLKCNKALGTDECTQKEAVLESSVDPPTPMGPCGDVVVPRSLPITNGVRLEVVRCLDEMKSQMSFYPVTTAQTQFQVK